MAESEAAHRRAIENRAVDADIEGMRREFAEARLGQIFAFGVTIVFAGLGTYLAASASRPGGNPVKLSVSTQETQGQRPNDFSSVPEGELLIFNLLIKTCSLDPDSPCGCGRSMYGMESLKATTTKAVQELPLAADAYKTAIREPVLRSGFQPTGGEIDALDQDLTEAASFFEPGEVIEYRGDYFSFRPVPDHAWRPQDGTHVGRGTPREIQCSQELAMRASSCAPSSLNRLSILIA